ncbi:MAG: tripartite tricarboxylate transporter substrate binding protein [Burkholderiales bacterium]|nr:tripartite tricarboxylate transporter substrate binding protein [Burkholderiales bacterium]
MSYRKLVIGLALGACALVAPALAQQVTRIVVPFAAGGGTDQYCRILAQELNKQGLNVIIENKPGASGILAADYVARAKPDGQTVLVSSLGTLANNSVLYDKLPYDPAKDFAAVTQIAYQPAIVVGRTDLPYKNIKALLGNQIDIHGTSITGSLPYVKAGKLRVLGVMDSKRLPQVPDAPTFKEQGFDMEATLWYSLSVPAGTPRPAIERLNKAVNQVIADPDFVARARAIGMEPRGGTPEELDKFIKAEADRWLPVLRGLNLPKQSH